MDTAVAGWYPVDGDPGYVQYWDGIQWTGDRARLEMASPDGGYDHSGRPVGDPSVFAVAQVLPLGQAIPPAVFRRRRRFYAKRPFRISAVAVVLLGVVLLSRPWSGSPGDSNSAELAAASTDEPATVESFSVEADGTDPAVAANFPGSGTLADPYQFGQFYADDSGIPGVNLEISIDEVRTGGVPIDPTLVVEGQTQSCIAIVGSVKLGSDDGQQAAPASVAIPEPTVVAGGATVSPSAGCDLSALTNEGLVPHDEVTMAPVSTARWFATFLVTDDAYESVASGPNFYAP